MRKAVLLLLLLCCFIKGEAFKHNTISDDTKLHHLYFLAAKSINYSSTSSEKELLSLCQKMEILARNQMDYENLFMIQQIAVNTHCITGDIGLAVIKAQQMYEEAKMLKNRAGIALSMQAIGNTYMYSSQYVQASESFDEARKLLEGINNNLISIRLLFQLLHVHMLVEDIPSLEKTLAETYKLINNVEIANKADYAFYLQCYSIYHKLATQDLMIEDNNHVTIDSINDIKPLPSTDQLRGPWYYILRSVYYGKKQEYDKSILYCDSALNIAEKGKNVIGYKKLLLTKAALLAENNKKKEACDIYHDVKMLNDSLSAANYTAQIESLHTNTKIDQIEIDSTTMHNRLLRIFILCGIIALIIAIVLLYIARKKNRQLIESRIRLEAIKKESADSIQSKSLFLSNMSHELRTPLNAIVGFSDLLAMEDEDDDTETKLQYVDQIKQNSDLLLRLFNDVADLSALKENRMTFTHEDCNIVPICQNVISTVKNVKQTSADLKFKTEIKSLYLNTDVGRLQQVLINLLINATKFTSQGTITLILKIDEENDMAVFIVEDTGCGIPLEKQPKIFERFEKLHEGVQGAGLGLSICQLIVEHNGGKIWIDSEYTEGARFIFTHKLATPKKDNDL